ncbi:sensor histidine kinase [Amycolatopsis keratiniphila]|uniref:sensor histidine kinase n=1 Tax=Amycolatopsis keratiniphila TaxID=129921 RepID=UPI00087D639D|nr:sensor histidine kinase [Amycolatopsis keratiniphila]OLZ56319.1 two-component sensor histidine kinase [Amycolatopsis keratiniphila subsp. nogabecina]SDU53284.1 Histidine kinase-, DNA gyrase B-, and HSP90-like ATPase [Amycolatopsis keratiniphila]
MSAARGIREAPARDYARLVLSFLRNHPKAVDIGLTVILGLSTVVASDDPEGFGWWLTSLVALASLLVRHRSPAITFVTGATVSLLHLAMGNDLRPVDVVALIGLFSVAAWGSRRLSFALLAASLLVTGAWTIHAAESNSREPDPIPPRIIIIDRLAPPEPKDDQVQDWGGFAGIGLSLTVAWLAGLNTRQRRIRLSVLEQRAADLERERDTQAALAVAAERGRISRELHDVVAHALSVVVLQAQGAQAELERRPERTREALDAIVGTGRTALAEIRRLLGALGQDEPDWEPQPGAERLPRLAADIRAAGTPVEFRVEGEPRPLPSTVDLAAYRIVQEALTNVLKHAGPAASVTIVMRYEPETLEIEVTDDGTAAEEPSGAGHGLEGMRERVNVLGGTFDAGPRPERGFAVRATLPT